MVVVDVAHVQESLLLVGREHHAARGAAGRIGRDWNFLDELPLLVGDVNAVARPICRVDQSVVGDVERQVALELLRHRSARRVGTVGVTGRDVR